MSTAAQEAKARILKRKATYSTKVFNRCQLCGRSRAYMRMFKICRLCFRKRAMDGQLPGVKRSSW